MSGSALPAASTEPASPIGGAFREYGISLCVFALLAIVPLLGFLGPEGFVLPLVTRMMILALAAISLDFILGYGGHLWSHGLDGSRVQANLEVLMRGEAGWREAAREVEADLVFWGFRERGAFGTSRRPWERLGPLLAEGEWGALYAVEAGRD